MASKLDRIDRMNRMASEREEIASNHFFLSCSLHPTNPVNPVYNYWPILEPRLYAVLYCAVIPGKKN
jgi:hypothetical protein